MGEGQERVSGKKPLFFGEEKGLAATSYWISTASLVSVIKDSTNINGCCTTIFWKPFKSEKRWHSMAS